MYSSTYRLPASPFLWRGMRFLTAWGGGTGAMLTSGSGRATGRRCLPECGPPVRMASPPSPAPALRLGMRTVAACRGAINGLTAEIIEDHIRYHLLRPAPQDAAEQAKAA